MTLEYEIEDKKLKKMAEEKAQELNVSVYKLIWRYINRGLIDDNFDEELFNKVHSEKFLKEVDNALGFV